MIKDYIFTITNGRSGQATLHEYIKLYSKECLSAFEEPHITPLLPNLLVNIEKKIRRRYFETHELLGRGKVLLAYEEKNYAYIEKIANLRLKKIQKQAKLVNASIYFDISKFYIRGLYKGFNNALNSYKLILLIRDPLLNMKSYINRNKNFFLDNSAPYAKNNILNLRSELNKKELYLWSWCETFLRYKKISRSKKVKKSLVLNTSDLDNSKKIEKVFDYLEIKYKPIKKINKLNTNVKAGNFTTKVYYKDLELLKNFILKLPKNHKSLLNALNHSISINEKKIL